MSSITPERWLSGALDRLTEPSVVASLAPRPTRVCEVCGTGFTAATCWRCKRVAQCAAEGHVWCSEEDAYDTPTVLEDRCGRCSAPIRVTITIEATS